MLSWRHLLYNGMYVLGAPPWDTGIPPHELVAIIEGPNALPAGHALDLGCGTGTSVLYLAQHGWKVVGVDFAAAAIEKARKKAARTSGATLVEGDVSRLSQLGITGPFDFVLDMGCYHGLSATRRRAYVQEVARVTRSGALFMVWAVASARRPIFPGAPHMQDEEIPERFGQDFRLEPGPQGNGRQMANWYMLRRR